MLGLYINLEHRKDRNEHILSLINTIPFFSNIKRFNAIKHDKGIIGCGMSHYECLENLKNLVIQNNKINQDNQNNDT